jgi:superoxide dismutase, Fe-Mn family
MKTTRRTFIQQAVKATVASSFASPLIAATPKVSSAHSALQSNPNELPFQSQVPLPFVLNALEPYIDAQTMEIHYGKHHTAYVKNITEAIAAEKITYSTDKEFFSNISKVSAKARNNGGGVWNHNFFWKVMKPGSTAPSGKVADAINASFESFDKFKEQFTQAATTRFGSGWAWLVTDGGKLKIGSTPNQDNPLMDVSEFKGTPLLALDVWEHAYYLKYQNKRNEYVTNWWNVVNWGEVARRLSI